VNLREPLEDEILVRMLASGICHADIAFSAIPGGAPGFMPYPKTMGHEGSGIVERVGSGISHIEKGDKVLLSFDYCGKDECRACVDETPGYCGEFGPRNILGVPDVYRGTTDEALVVCSSGSRAFQKWRSSRARRR
jgi:Zn-dependent alcohol dehydrogenase